MKFAIGQRVRFWFGPADIIKARYAITSNSATGVGTVAEVSQGTGDNILYRLDDLEIQRGKEEVDGRMGTGKLWAKGEELRLEPLPITDETTLDEVRKMLNEATAHIQDDGGWSPTYRWARPEIPKGKTFWEYVKNCRFIAVYHIEGSNEGHYVHVDALGGIDTDGTIKGVGLFLLKTFGGLEQAQLIQDTVQVLLAV